MQKFVNLSDFPFAALILSLGLMLSTPALAGQTTIKTAVVMPEGSTWTGILYEMAREVQERTKGGVKFKIYPGGVSGDEPDVIRKMHVNRIQAAGFSGIGLGMILPQIRIFESVLLFQSYAQIDLARESFFDHFAQQYEQKGFILLGFFEAGFTYIFSKKPLTNLKEIHDLKMWVWKGDRIGEGFLKIAGVQAVPLHMTDVITGLETGMIDTFYSPPLAAVALQWYARVDCMLDFPLVNSLGAFLVRKKTFQRLSPAEQTILKDAVQKYSAKLVGQTRMENQEALLVLQEAGIRIVKPTPEIRDHFEESARKAIADNIPGLYSQALLDQVRKTIAESGN
jgi:TRAP-type C4-dicarboxylate transport system substrate-binding protein